MVQYVAITAANALTIPIVMNYFGVAGVSASNSWVFAFHWIILLLFAGGLGALLGFINAVFIVKFKMHRSSCRLRR